MRRIDTPTAAADLFGPGKPGFRDGNPALAILATRLNAAFFNALQEEVASVIEGAGMALDSSDNGQLLEAINALIADSALDTLNTVRVNVASAPTINLAGLSQNTRHIHITGATAIVGFTVAAGRCYFVRFAGALTLTNSAALVTQAGANIVTAAGDTCIIRATAANVVEVLCYVPAGLRALVAEKAPLESAALTGIPTAPTAAAGNSTAQLATTAFVAAVQALLNSAIALRAPLASPAFTGAPTAPVPAAATNNTQLANTAWVRSRLAELGVNTAALTDPGFWRDDDTGFMVQFGNVSITSSPTAYLFKTAFPSTCLLCMPGPGENSTGGGAEVMNVEPGTRTRTGFSASATFVGTYPYIAIGF